MRGSLSRARSLTAALAVVVVAAVAAASASATTGTATANGLTVVASLSPDSASKGQTVTQRESVTNSSQSTENVRIRIAGPLPTAFPITFSVTLKPSASFSMSTSFPAGLLKPGTHSLTVAAAVSGGAATMATASITIT
jgi:hypothetical protein